MIPASCALVTPPQQSRQAASTAHAHRQEGRKGRGADPASHLEGSGWSRRWFCPANRSLGVNDMHTHGPRAPRAISRGARGLARRTCRLPRDQLVSGRAADASRLPGRTDHPVLSRAPGRLPCREPCREPCLLPGALCLTPPASTAWSCEDGAAASTSAEAGLWAAALGWSSAGSGAPPHAPSNARDATLFLDACRTELMSFGACVSAPGGSGACASAPGGGPAMACRPA